MKHSFQKQEGQVLIFILLVILVALTIGLSVAGRTITGLREASELEDSTRAYSLAEAGVEEALQKLKEGVGTPSEFTGSFGSAGSYKYTITTATDFAGGVNAYETVLKRDEAVEIDLSGVALDGEGVNIYWGKNGGGATDDVDCGTSPYPAAIQFVYLAQNSGGDYAIKHKEAFDGCHTRADTNGFTKARKGSPFAEAEVGEVGYYFHTVEDGIGGDSITLNSDETVRRIRIRAWYNDAHVIVVLDPTETIPAQGYVVRSTGTSGTTQRTVQVTRSNPSLPAIFDYVLFSGEDLSK